MSEDASKPAVGLDATVSAPGSTPRTSRSTGSGDAATEAALAPGATLGRYVLVEALGAGGMGMVFRARDPDLGREVAIKVLRTGETTGSGGSLERRLLREAQAMATVSHDNLANVFDIGTTAGRVFIAMELVDGGTLRKLIADPDKPWRDKLSAVIAAGRGLAAAHSAGVIHRDFKPDNVLIARTGRVKVVDFGLARADRSDRTGDPTVDGGGEPALPPDLSAQLTQTGALLGTPAYMAPEQHAGEIVDARSDQFAFAVTAWEAVYGKRPYATDAYSSLVAAVRAHDITPPPKKTGVPPALEAVLRRALSPDPADRFTSMDATIEAITAAIRPRRRIAPLIAVGAVVCIGGGVVAVVALDGDDPPAKRRGTNKLGSADQIQVEVVPFDLADVHEISGKGVDSSEAALDKMMVSRTLQAHGDDLIECYSDAEIDRPGLVRIEFEVSATGKVTSYKATQNDFADTDLANCLGANAMEWTFPPARDGKAHTWTFPFRFSAPREVGAGDDDDGVLSPGDLDELRRLDFGSGFPFDTTPPVAPVPPVPPVLTIPPPGGPAAIGPAADLDDRMDAEIREVGDDHYTITRAIARAILADPVQMSSARIVPTVGNGKDVGFKLYGIRSGGVYERLGLTNGDTVRSLNGVGLTSPDQIVKSIAAEESASTLVLKLTRQGDPMAVTIDVLP